MLKSPRYLDGFSTVELMVALGIIMLIATISMPSITRTIADVRMRASMTSLSGVIQNCRMVAVKENRTMSAHIEEFGSGLVGYIKRAGDTSEVQSSDIQVQLQSPIVDYAAPTGSGAPSGMSVAVLGFTATAGVPSFNSRGLPCEYNAGTCTSKGFVWYFKDTSQPIARSWAALAVSPAGRIKRWFWNGTAWVD